MQESRELEQVASAPAKADKAGGMPGFLPVASATVLSAILCSIWLLSDSAAPSAPDGGAGMVMSDLAPVNDQEVAGALTTIDGPPAFLARFKERANGCALPLAWVAVSSMAGQPAGSVRLRSGTYFSPDFKLSDVP